jgi:hypothetical protein
VLRRHEFVDGALEEEEDWVEDLGDAFDEIPLFR